MGKTHRSRFSHIGGHPAPDLVNTVHWRLDPRRRDDKLRSFMDVVAWAVESGVVEADEFDESGRSDDTNEVARPQLAVVVSLREDFFHAAFHHDQDAANRIRAAAAAAISAARASENARGWRWQLDASAESITHRIALQLSALLTDPQAAVLTQCSDEACGWIYLDHSPRNNRLWCSSADCGNRNRVRNHAQRQRTQKEN